MACVVKSRGFMDDVFFGVKRGHLAVNAWALGRLKDFGVTPARFDLMRMIYERNYRRAQSELRRMLGVARATISRMVRSLEKLGWITREVNPYDRRTRDCDHRQQQRRGQRRERARIVEAVVHLQRVAECDGGEPQ